MSAIRCGSVCPRGVPWGGFARRRADRTGRRGSVRVEQAAVIGLAAAAGPAVQIDRGDAIGPADGFDVNSWPSPTGSNCEVSGANGSECLPTDLPHPRQAPWSPSVSSVPPANCGR